MRNAADGSVLDSSELILSGRRRRRFSSSRLESDSREKDPTHSSLALASLSYVGKRGEGEIFQGKKRKRGDIRPAQSLSLSDRASRVQLCKRSLPPFGTKRNSRGDDDLERRGREATQSEGGKKSEKKSPSLFSQGERSFFEGGRSIPIALTLITWNSEGGKRRRRLLLGCH